MASSVADAFDSKPPIEYDVIYLEISTKKKRFTGKQYADRHIHHAVKVGPNFYQLYRNPKHNDLRLDQRPIPEEIVKKGAKVGVTRMDVDQREKLGKLICLGFDRRCCDINLVTALYLIAKMMKKEAKPKADPISTVGGR